MKKQILSAFSAVMLTTVAYGIPELQLDISGGSYNVVDETVYNTTDPFTLYALVDTPNLTGTTYYLSIAIVPKTSDTSLPGFGSFTIDGTVYNSGSSWNYGVPPVDAAIADIGPHGIFPTLYLELSFSVLEGFANSYNTQDNPGGFSLYGGVGDKIAYKDFAVNTTNLGADYALHFDLYTYSDDDKVDAFAPFSHDAQTTHVPDGGTTAILLGAALAGVGVVRRYLKV